MAIGLVSLVFAVILLFAGIFLTVLCFVAVFKVFQIAEDLRYMRSRNDIKVERPKPYSNLIVKCLAISGAILIVCVLLCASSLPAVTANFNTQSNTNSVVSGKSV